MTAPEPFEVYAIKYAEREARRGDHFIGGDPHDAPMDMDYFVWALKRGDEVWVVDTGFDVLDAERRSRRLVRTVREGLALVGVESHDVDNVIITHLHYDHIGGYEHFPKAQFHLQDKEMAYATGRNMTRPAISHAYTADHIADLVFRVFEARVTFHDGEADLAPGLSVHWVGGHTAGLQVVRVWTRIGWIVLASDASHYYENMNADRPFVIVWNQGEILEAFDTMRALSDDPEWIVPGHDPLVFDRYDAPSDDLKGKVIRLDAEPKPG